jgi:hypothetical protein
VSQSSDGAFGNGASVVTDDLYVSRMENKHGGGGGNERSRGGGNKISQADLEAYNRSR